MVVRYSYGTRLTKMEDSSLGNRSSSVSQLLGIVLHKILCAPALMAYIVQLVAGLITMISLTMLAYLDKLNRVTRRWGEDNNINYFGSFETMI